ncbi:uncharacterized protein LOC129801656 isoform X2 [Phlebotomus papatasi]|nr:uncharacterized protein LOC129801656 isoform X2 [Phlebotomus papatasi]
MLETLVNVYKPHFTLALNPHHYSSVDLTRYRNLCGHERKIFYFFERLLDLHKSLCQLLWECEDALDIAQVFFNWILEDNLNIYVKHSLLNPLRRPEVQQEFDTFMSECLENVEIVGMDAYTMPVIHFFYYKETLSTLLDICSSNDDFVGLQMVEKSLKALNNFLDRYNLSSEAMETENLQANVPLIGYCLCRGEFQAREYVEGLKEKVILYLFQHGLLVIKPKRSTMKQSWKHIFHSFCDLQHIDVDKKEIDIRLKCSDTGRTYYRIKRRHSLLKKDKGVSIAQLVDLICNLKDEQSSSRDFMGVSQPPIEAVNLPVIQKMQFYSFSLQRYGLSSKSLTSFSEDNGKYLDAFNLPCIERFLLQKSQRTQELYEIIRQKTEQFMRFQRIERERFEHLSTLNYFN